jgi:hypothetical protein
MNSNYLKIAGLMLYAGEGAKTGRTVDLANSDPVIIETFVKFLRNCCQIKENRLKFYLYCFDNQPLQELISFWCSLLKTTPSQFTKPYIRTAAPQLRRVAQYGVIHVRYSDKQLHAQLLAQIQKLFNDL